MNNPTAEVRDETDAKKNGDHFGRFWVKKARHPETFSGQKCYLYRSMCPPEADISRSGAKRPRNTVFCSL